jgi:AraC family transcriptional regulator of adaptative response/methylated-DNA-[protein]-cysteine methyltransferase
MTPGEYKNGAAELSVFYAYYDSPFGCALLASTSKGLCHMAFCEDEKEALQELIERFPNATFKQEATEFHRQALAFFEEKHPEKKISLHLKGSPFQLKVWEALLKIPMGEVSSYGNIAQMIQQPSAARAVGTAIGSNPIAFLIPCHRVIQQAGMTGGYRWNPLRKKAMLGWEAAKTNTNERLEE